MNPLTKRLAIVLAISLGINLLLCGFLLGHRLHPSPPPVPSGHARNVSFLRERMRMKHGKGDMRPEWRAFQSGQRTARERVARALATQPFEVKELEDALAELREHTTQGQKALHDELVEQAKADPKFREKLAREFRRPGPHGGK